MSIKISGAPCSWGVDDPNNPYLPPWKRVLREAAQAGYRGIELGPYGYLPLEVEQVQQELEQNGLNVIAGTIFDDLVSEGNLENLIQQVRDICSLITKLPQVTKDSGQHFKTPYLVLIDWGHDERDYEAGHPDRAPRLSKADWKKMIDHIKQLAELAWSQYTVRAVVHPHAGGYIEFADEIDQLAMDLPYETAGLCLDTGHLYYGKMDPVAWIRKYSARIDYIHFKDVSLSMYEKVMQERIRFFDACGKGVMCPIGKGDLDYPKIYELLKEIDYHGYITIEQERDPRNAETSLRDVKESLDYLKSIGF